MSDFLGGNIWISNYVSLHAVIEMRQETGFWDMHVPDSEFNQVLAPFQFKSVNLNHISHDLQDVEQEFEVEWQKN